jgi:hypothetical protein
MSSLMNGGLPTWLGLHLLNTEERGARTGTGTGWADPTRRSSWALSRPVQARSSPRGSSWNFALGPLHLCHFEVIIPMVKIGGSLCMDFQYFHLGPREFSIQAHWSLPPLGASSHMIGAPWLSCKMFSEAGPIRPGRSAWALCGPVQARSSPSGSSWHFALGPLHLCHF